MSDIRRIVLSLSIIGFLLLIGMVYMATRKPYEKVALPADSGNVVKPRPEPRPIDTYKPKKEVERLARFTVDELYNAYAENEVASDENFKNKYFEVEGIIDSVEKDILGKPYIILVSETSKKHSLHRVQATIHDTCFNFISTLRKGEKINIECIGNGKIVWPLVRATKMRTGDSMLPDRWDCP